MFQSQVWKDGKTKKANELHSQKKFSLIFISPLSVTKHNFKKPDSLSHKGF